MRGNEQIMFRILTDKPELLDDPQEKESECDASNEDNEDGDESDTEEESSCNATDCNDEAAVTLNRFKKRRKVV